MIEDSVFLVWGEWYDAFEPQLMCVCRSEQKAREKIEELEEKQKIAKQIYFERYGSNFDEDKYYDDNIELSFEESWNIEKRVNHFRHIEYRELTVLKTEIEQRKLH